MNNNIKILDCTLRDGGYCNNWDFSIDLVKEYLQAMELAKVDVIELGLRTRVNDRFFGPYSYTTDELINSLPLPQNAKIAVMINAKEFLDSKVDGIDNIFAPKSSSPVDIVRVACHTKELKDIGKCLEFLSGNGYQVVLNIMQITDRTGAEIKEAIEIINSFNCVDVLYFADSFGNMSLQETTKIIDLIKLSWHKEIGIHTHDNQYNGISNTLESLEQNVTWLDSTVLGMGRGAGNTRTEYLLLELRKRGFTQYQPEPLFPLVLGSFKKLKKELNWGPNLLYYLSASYKIHPTFTQELLNKKCSVTELIDTIENLSQATSTSYNSEALNDAFKARHINSTGTWHPAELVKGKDVLIIGGGNGAIKYSKAIEQYIKKFAPITISLNMNTTIYPDLITAYSACHPMRLMMDSSKYKNLKKPIILPENSLPKSLKENLADIQIFNYGLSVKEGSFSFQGTECELPNPLVFGYTIAAAAAGGAKRILLAGFDGYGPNNYKQDEINSLLALYHQVNPHTPILAITPTTYNIKQSSVYSPSL